MAANPSGFAAAVAGSLVHDPSTNQPPLAELLAEEIATDRARMEVLVASANRAPEIKDAETQQKVTALGNLLRQHHTAVEAKRVERKRPFDNDVATVQRVFRAVLAPIEESLKSLRRINDEYEDALEKEREAERRRLAEEEARRRREVEEAERRAAAAEEAGASDVAARIAALKAEEAAEVIAGQREAIKAEVVRTDVGISHRTTVRKFEIENVAKVLEFFQSTDQYRETLIAILQPTIDKLGRAGLVVPGVKVRTIASTRFR